MDGTSAKDQGSQRIMAGYGHLACNGNGHLVMMEHKGGIERVVGTMGMGLGIGSNSTSPLRLSPMRPLIHNGQVFKSCSLVQ